MDILITGAQGTGKTRAAHRLLADHFGVKSIYDVTIAQLFIVTQLNIMRVDVLRETIRAARTEAVLFDECLTTAANFLVAAQAVKEAREQTGRDLFVIYVRQTDEPTVVTTKFGANFDLKRDFAFNPPSPVIPIDNIARLECTDATATHLRYPLTWDNRGQAYQLANLEVDGAVVCEAVNVYRFRAPYKADAVLFELGDFTKGSGDRMAIAKDGLNTLYFESGKFPQRMFNANSVRPAEPAEVLEYLNAKYKFQNENV